jgi:hypothetical protein
MHIGSALDMHPAISLSAFIKATVFVTPTNQHVELCLHISPLSSDGNSSNVTRKPASNQQIICMLDTYGGSHGKPQ